MADLVVVDEASMLHLALARRLAAEVRDGCHLLFVGDADQLPSVGTGRVLRDLADVEEIPRSRLTKVFRQHDESAAVVSAAAGAQSPVGVEGAHLRCCRVGLVQREVLHSGAQGAVDH
ncbi:AAA family ATPase [Streptomyces longispororuber]|uniref:AAA family ATPase n=1 Tax=Streptomyces longispororuber TaxID=68230 RepID=UPI0021096823|nr:AAA family ATPase [Streptomyces longispororuber]MCQ4207553.1 AAA family ATPase [Streptomyces longispororuber]